MKPHSNGRGIIDEPYFGGILKAKKGSNRSWEPIYLLTGLAGGECRAEGWKKVFIENDSSQQSNAILQKMSTHQYFDAFF